MARSKAKLRSHHKIAYLHPLTNIHTKYQPSTLYRFQDIVMPYTLLPISLLSNQASTPCSFQDIVGTKC